MVASVFEPFEKISAFISFMRAELHPFIVNVAKSLDAPQYYFIDLVLGQTKILIACLKIFYPHTTPPTVVFSKRDACARQGT